MKNFQVTAFVNYTVAVLAQVMRNFRFTELYYLNLHCIHNAQKSLRPTWPPLHRTWKSHCQTWHVRWTPRCPTGCIILLVSNGFGPYTCDTGAMGNTAGMCTTGCTIVLDNPSWMPWDCGFRFKPNHGNTTSRAKWPLCWWRRRATQRLPLGKPRQNSKSMSRITCSW